MSKRCLLLYCILCSFVVAHAQTNARFLHFNVRDGLSQNSVHCIFQDRDGLMWIGTQDGLNSFDGKDFTVYRHDDNDTTTISDQFVVAIKEDKDGYLWIGTRNGLNRFNKRTGKFTRFYINEKEKHTFQAHYTHFYFQKDGKIIIPRNLVSILDPVTKTFQKIPLLDSAIAVHVTDNYKVFFVSTKMQQYVCDDIRRPQFRLLNGRPLPLAFSGIPWTDKNANDTLIYYNSGNTILPYNYLQNKFYPPITIPYHLNDIYIASSTESYASTTNGIYKISNNTDVSLLKSSSNDQNHLSPGSILCSYKDREGNLWVGTAGNGFAVSSPSFNNFILLKPPVENDIVSCIYKQGNTVYFGTRSGIYSTEVAAGISFTAVKSILANKKVTALTMDHNGQLWAAIENEGIWIINKNGSIIKKIGQQNSVLENRAIIQMTTDSKGRILISTELNFYIAASVNDPLVKFSVPDKRYHISGNYVMSAFEDKDKNIWICNNFGIDVYDTDLKHVRSFLSNTDSTSPIKRTIVTNCTQDRDGAIWISTIRNGVYRYADNDFTHYTTSSGLGSEVVYNVLCDDRNRIWAVTSAGLNIFDNEQKSFAATTALDGVPNTGFVLAAVFKDASGNLLFGTSDGLLFCNANEIGLHKTNISARIDDVKVNGQSIDIGSKSFSLIADNKVIVFEFSASPAFFSGNIIYQYRLRGMSDEWVTLPKAVHSISYTGLPYKELQLEVRAATSLNNLEHASISTLTIKSKAPVWKTTWFIIVAVIALIGLIWLLMMELNKKRYQKQLQVLKMEKQLQGERERIGRDLHDNIGAYTSALIAGLNQVRPTDAEQVKHVDDLKDYAVNIMGFLRETIWMLNTQTLTVTAFTDRFKNYAIRISKNYPAIELAVKENIIENKTLAPAIMLNLFRILQEALQNAYKHSNATNIQVLFSSNGHLYFEVFDNGSGFTEEEKAEHYGLANMRQRAAEAGFTFTIESHAGNGTKVCIKENTAYAASAI